MSINMIVAHDENGAIGFENQLLWDNQRSDMGRFKELTTGGVVIMGRKTWESIPSKFRPLPNRTNIIVTSTPSRYLQETFAVNSLDEAVRRAQAFSENIWIIGGARVYKEAMPYIKRIYQTIVHHKYKNADAHVEIPNWTVIQESYIDSSPVDSYPMTFKTLER